MILLFMLRRVFKRQTSLLPTYSSLSEYSASISNQWSLWGSVSGLKHAAESKKHRKEEEEDGDSHHLRDVFVHLPEALQNPRHELNS